MQQIQRLKRGPERHQISNVSIIRPTFHNLTSGVPLFSYQTPGIGAIKLEIIFDAGRLYEAKRLVSQSCASLIIEGCESHTSAEISEAIDFEGAYLTSSGSSDFISIKMICAKKSFQKLIPLLRDIISSPTFSQQELDTFIKRRKQKMAINLTKNDIISYRSITESIYGPESTYGYNSTYEMLDDLKTSDLKNHYNQNCTKERANIFLSGDYDQNDLGRIEELSNHLKEYKGTAPSYEVNYTNRESIHLKGRENQSSLKLALPLFNRSHDQYPGVYFLNTILGGYFGSRLMKNIREEKGFTYNIYSMLDTYKYDGAWIISCELDEEYVNDTVKQISFEFDRLKSELISAQELEMVKNYLIGNFMSSINGPFKALNPSKMEVSLGLKPSFYNNLTEQILAFDANHLQSLAQEFLNIDNFWKVIVGKA